MIIKKIFLLMLVLGCIQWSTAQDKPNIVLIFADDLGYKDCGFTGSSTFETPHLDSLAGMGMVFNNAYAGGGNCAPSRACLLSGLYTPRHGIYAVGSTTRGPKNKMRLVPVRNNQELDPSFVTVAEALKARGYATGIFGKWHLGKRDEVLPGAQGFDTWFDNRADNPNRRREEPEDPKEIFSLTSAAINFMEANKKKPFFVYLSHHAIHEALEAKPATVEYFKNKGLEQKKALYAACIYNLDESVGLVTAYLKSSGLDKNTLVIFTSDNGATPQSPQEPLRGNKGGYYEGGIREPFIACWPGKIRKGSQNNTPIINLDLYPTFLALAGKTDVHLDGENLWPLLNGSADNTKRDKLFWHFPGYLGNPVIRGRDSIFRTRPVTVMRKGNWKILLYHEEWLLDGGIKNLKHNNAIELYNLKEDQGEQNNLALVNTRKRDELLADMLHWLKVNKVPMPVKRGGDNRLEESDGDTDEN